MNQSYHSLFVATPKGMYCMRSSGEIIESYLLERCIGTGSHAMVWQGKRSNSPERVAIKHLFFDDTEKLKRSYREIKLLQHFAGQENIVTPLDLLTDDKRESFTSIFLVMNLCKTDLHKLLRSSQFITIDHIKLFSSQLIRAVSALHEANVIHRDLKPQNILIDTTMDKNNRSQLQLMLCDFGTGRFVHEDQDLRRTSLHCVTTAFYCAPEGILNKDYYSSSVDIWAVGCIIAEMILRTPFFQGKNLKHQLQLIVDVCGKPTEEDLTLFPEGSRKRFLMEYDSTHHDSIVEKLPPDTDPKAVDLLRKLLVFNPKQRLSANEAYEHVFLEPYNRLKKDISKDPFEDLVAARNDISIEEWKDLLWEEVMNYRRKKETTNMSTEEDLWGD